MSTAVYNTLGTLSDKIIKRDFDAYLWPESSSVESQFRIIHTSTTTIIISEGLLKNSIFPMEFYVEINGIFSSKELEHHFLVSFLDKTIEEALQETNLKEKLNDEEMRSITFKISFFSGINNYFVKEQEGNVIGALVGVTSSTMPKKVKIKDRDIALINVRPFSNTWVKKLDEIGEDIIPAFSEMLSQFKLAYGNYLSPFKHYSDDGKGRKVSNKEQKKINKKLENFYEKSDHEDTLAYINKLLGDSIEYYNLLFTKAKTLSLLGKREEAVEAYHKVIALYPKESQPYLNIAAQLNILEKYEEAIEQYDFVITNFTGDSVDKAYYDRGMIHARLHSFDQAIDDVSSSPYSFANRQVAKFYICNKDIEGAIDFIKNTIDEEYEDFKAIFHFYLMICYFLIDDHEKAEIAHQDFLRTKKKNAKNQGRLDEIILHLDKGDEFRAMLEEKGGAFFTYDKPDWAK